MTPEALFRALQQLPPRAAQTLLFRCVERRTAEGCAALYGIGLEQWKLLFFEAARGLVGEVDPLPDAQRVGLAAQLHAAFEGTAEPAELAHLLTPLRRLVEHREEIERLRAEAERAAAASPARARETWLRRLAVVAIIAVSLFVWLRDRDKPPPPVDPRTRQLPLPRQ